ncbi:MAG TPA: hypothetical protein VIR31_00055 [Nitrososphaeraceae archaeon]
MKYFKDNNGNVFAYDESQMDLVGDKTPMSDEEVELHLNPPKTAQEILQEKWSVIENQWQQLTVTTTSGNKFSANKTAMEYIAFKANNMGDTAVILWVEEWGEFNTDIVELKEVLNLAADAHQTIVNSIFGA